MALTHATNVRNAMMDAIDEQVNGGSTDAQADFVFVESNGPTDIAEINLQDPAFGNSSSGQITIQGTPLSTSANSGGTIDTFEIRDKDNSVAIDGTVTSTGGGGDVEIDNTNVNSGQTVQLDSYSQTAPS
jgi:hypothetical protein